jgi:hypothetical protein
MLDPDRAPQASTYRQSAGSGTQNDFECSTVQPEQGTVQQEDEVSLNASAFAFGGMFKAFEDSVYSRYAGAVTWRDRLAGGTPSDPKLIEGWLKSKMPGMTNDLERRHMLLRTLREMGAEIPETDDIMAIDMEQLEEAAARVAASRGANGFKRPNRVVRLDGTVEHPGYLAIETRHLKAGLNGALAA